MALCVPVANNSAVGYGQFQCVSHEDRSIENHCQGVQCSCSANARYERLYFAQVGRLCINSYSTDHVLLLQTPFVDLHKRSFIHLLVFHIGLSSAGRICLSQRQPWSWIASFMLYLTRLLKRAGSHRLLFFPLITTLCNEIVS
jgi:hypothetical protein